MNAFWIVYTYYTHKSVDLTVVSSSTIIKPSPTHLHSFRCISRHFMHILFSSLHLSNHPSSHFIQPHYSAISKPSLPSRKAPNTTRLTTPLCSLLLEELRDFDLDVEELGGAAVDADAFAFVDFTFAVFFWDALFHAGLLKSEIGRLAEDL